MLFALFANDLEDLACFDEFDLLNHNSECLLDFSNHRIHLTVHMCHNAAHASFYTVSYTPVQAVPIASAIPQPNIERRISIRED